MLPVAIPDTRNFKTCAACLWGQASISPANGILAAHGYHTLAEQYRYQEHELYNNNKAEFLVRYLADRRADELEILKQLAPHILVCPEKIWLMTVVAKQDLWWDEKSEAERFYRSGDFANVTSDIAATRGGQAFRYETVFVSLLISNFDDSLGSRLKKNVAGYDQREQVSTLLRLMKSLFDLKVWGDS